MNSTRTGKIARLPHTLREQLNQRLADGAPGPDLLAWLNGLEPVREILATQFDGKPINAQNLTEWKQGGYRDWERAVESRVLAQEFIAEAQGLAEETGEVPLADRLSSHAALALGQLLRAAMDETGPERYALVFKVVRELERLRRGDHRQSRVAFQRERWETEREEAAEAAALAELIAQQEKLDKLERKKRRNARFMVYLYEERLRTKDFAEGEQAKMEAHFRAHPKYYPDWAEETATAGTPSGEDAEAVQGGEVTGDEDDQNVAMAHSGHAASAGTPSTATEPARPAKPARSRAAQSNSNQIKPIQTSK